MSLKNYIFSSVNYKGGQDSDKFATIRVKPKKPKANMASITEDGNGTTVIRTPIAVAPATTSSTTTNGTGPKGGDANKSYLKNMLKFWHYLSVEPLILCWLLPSCFLYIAVENLALEKSCRVNFNFTDLVCDNMIDKSKNNINCPEFREKMRQEKEIHLYSDRSQVLNDTHYFNGTSILSENNPLNITVLFDVTALEHDVCHAEIESQKLDTKLNAITSPFDSFFGIIMILFAGGWSDKRGRRKPCMLIPLLGELASLIVLLISAVFFKQLPLEFSSILGKLLPAVAGGANLMLMGVYSYLSETTADEDRTFRFGVFAQIVPLIPIASLPFSGILFAKLGYIKLLLMCIPINLIGVFYIIFALKEVKREKPAIERSGVDNAGFENTSNDNILHIREAQITNGRHLPNEQEEKKTNFLVDFFNPIVVVQCVQVIMRKRENQGRAIVILLFVMYFIAIGPAFGEEPNEYNFTRIQLNWGGIPYSTFATYGNALSLVGTIVMITLFSKLLKFSDAFLGIIGTILSSVSRILYASATTVMMLYVARTFDAFISIRALVLKSILSKFVEPDELGRSFSIIAIVEALAKFVFVFMYSIIYENTLESWPGAFYIASLIFLAITAVLFVILYFILKRNEKYTKAQKLEMEAVNETKQTATGETTHM